LSDNHSLSPQERADAIGRSKKRAIRQFDQREHLRLEVDCRTIMRDLSSIESVLHRGRELVDMGPGEEPEEAWLSRERIAALKVASDLKWRRLSLALPALKPVNRPIQSPFDLGPLITNEDRLGALIAISQQLACGDLLEEQAEALKGHVEAVHAMSTGVMLEQLMERIDSIEENSGGRLINASRREPPEASTDLELAGAIPSWGGDVTAKAQTSYEDITLIED
jgi:hypothetical protein